MWIKGTRPPHADRHSSRSVVGPLTIATRHAHSPPVHIRWKLTHRQPKASRSAARSRSPPTVWCVGKMRTWAVRTNRHMFQSDATIQGQIRVVKREGRIMMTWLGVWRPTRPSKWGVLHNTW